MHQLETDKSGRLVYNNQIIVTILGGLNFEKLDKLKVALKIEVLDDSEPPIRHQLDLYNNPQVIKLAITIASRFNMDINEIVAVISELTEQLELYRLEEIMQQTMLPQTQPLTVRERSAAISNLKLPNLMAETSQNLQKMGITGEENNSLALFLIMTSRKCEEPLSVICYSKNSLDKNNILDKIAGCIPEEDKKEYALISGESLYSYSPEEIKGKVFIVADVEADHPNLVHLWDLQSKKHLSKTVSQKGINGKLVNVAQIFDGPISIISHSVKEKIDANNTALSIPVYLDSSKEQEMRKMEHEKNLRAGLVDQSKEMEAQQKLRNMQMVLQPIKVINRYAPLIELPKELLKPGRTLPLVLSFIEAVTFYHQYQREQKIMPETSEIYIETSPKDIQLALFLLKGTLLRKSDELGESLRNFYEQLKSIVVKNKLVSFKAADIRRYMKISPRTLQYNLKELTIYGYLDNIGGKQRTGYVYEITVALSGRQLQRRIDQHIDRLIKKIDSVAKKTRLLSYRSQ